MLVMAVVGRSRFNEGAGVLAAAAAVVAGAGVIGNEVFGHGVLVAGDCAAQGSGIVIGIGSGDLAASPAKVDGSGIVGTETYQTPAYTNAGGTGNRTSLITVTTDAVLGGSSGPINRLVDGNKANGASNACWVNAGQFNVHLTFEFGNRVRITEAKWFQNGTSAGGGSWRWRGSNNGISFVDISEPFVLNAGGAGAIVGDLSGNLGGFKFYRAQLTGGPTTDTPWLWEIEFKIGNLT